MTGHVRAKDALALVQAYREGTLDSEQLESRLRAVSFKKPADAPPDEVEFCPVCGSQEGQLVAHGVLVAHVEHAVERGLQGHLISDHGKIDNRDTELLELLRER